MLLVVGSAMFLLVGGSLLSGELVPSARSAFSSFLSSRFTVRSLTTPKFPMEPSTTFSPLEFAMAPLSVASPSTTSVISFPNF